jgi:hypothetical protein
MSNDNAGSHDDEADDTTAEHTSKTEHVSKSERDMAHADVANGEGDPDGAANDTEEKYGEDESPA